jgi:hypothetical protein
VTETTTILTEAFDTPNEEGSKTFEPIPKGQYVASIKDAKAAPLKSGKGQAVSLTWEIESGEYENRLIFDRVIISHENADAMRIGRAKFKDIAVACDVTEAITDLAVICHKPCLVSVGIEADKEGQYPDKNKIARVKKIGETKKANGADAKPFDDKISY